MKYASENAGLSTSVHEWKPIPPEQFAELVHLYSTMCAAPSPADQPKATELRPGYTQEGHGGLYPWAFKLDPETTATIYFMPKSGQAPDAVSSPVLLTILSGIGREGRVICFKSLKHGLDSYGLGTKPVAKDPSGPAHGGTVIPPRS